MNTTFKQKNYLFYAQTCLNYFIKDIKDVYYKIFGLMKFRFREMIDLVVEIYIVEIFHGIVCY